MTHATSRHLFRLRARWWVHTPPLAVHIAPPYCIYRCMAQRKPYIHVCNDRPWRKVGCTLLYNRPDATSDQKTACAHSSRCQEIWPQVTQASLYLCTLVLVKQERSATSHAGPHDSGASTAAGQGDVTMPLSGPELCRVLKMAERVLACRCADQKPNSRNSEEPRDGTSEILPEPEPVQVILICGKPHLLDES